jgi:hypothetical protein
MTTERIPERIPVFQNAHSNCAGIQAVEIPIIDTMLMKLKGKRRNIKLLCQTIKVIYNVLAKPRGGIHENREVAPCSVAAFR